MAKLERDCRLPALSVLVWAALAATAAAAEGTSVPRFAESVAQSTHPACLEVERIFNASLRGPPVHTRTILPSVLENGTPLEKVPEGVATDAESDVAVADTNIQGHALKAVTYTVGGTCHDDYLELWDPAFRKRVSLVGSNIDTGQAPQDYALEDLVKLAGQTYFTHSTRTGGLVLVGFGKDLTSQALCSVDMMPLKHEALKSAADADLCEAVQAGTVAAAPIEDVSPYDVEPEALHLDAHGKELLENMSGGFQITARGHLDVDNDGKPDDIGMLAFGNGKDGAGCGHDVDTAVPIKLNPDGKPAASTAFNQKMIESAGAGEDTRLLVFRGKVYFETRSHLTADAVGMHNVWELSANGRKNMCEFIPIQYRAVDAPGH